MRLVSAILKSMTKFPRLRFALAQTLPLAIVSLSATPAWAEKLNFPLGGGVGNPGLVNSAAVNPGGFATESANLLGATATLAGDYSSYSVPPLALSAASSNGNRGFGASALYSSYKSTGGSFSLLSLSAGAGTRLDGVSNGLFGGLSLNSDYTSNAGVSSFATPGLNVGLHYDKGGPVSFGAVLSDVLRGLDRIKFGVSTQEARRFMLGASVTLPSTRSFGASTWGIAVNAAIYASRVGFGYDLTQLIGTGASSTPVNSARLMLRMGNDTYLVASPPVQGANWGFSLMGCW